MNDKPAAPNRLEKNKRRREQNNPITFALLCLWLFMIYARPEDLVRSIAHLPTAIAVLCLLAHVANSLSGDAEFVTLTPITKTIALLAVWALIGIPFAYWVKGSISTYFTHWAKMLLLCLLISQVVTTVKQLRIVVWIAVVSAAAVAAVSIALKSRGVSGRLEAIVSGPYSGANYLSIALLLMLPFVIFYAFVAKSALGRIWAAGLSFLLAAATLMTQSRAASITLGVIFVLVVIKLRRWSKRPLLAMGVLFLAVLPLLAMYGKGLAVRFGATTVASEGARNEQTVAGRTASSTYQRLQLLIRSSILTLKHPFMGVGIGGYAAASIKAFNITSSSEYSPTHNIYEQFSSELGIPGLMLFLFLLYYIYRAVKVTRRRITLDMLKNPEYRQLAWLSDAVAISLLAFTVQAFFASVAYDSYTYFLAGLAQAIYRLGRELPEPVEAKKRARRPVPAMWPRLENQQGGVVS